MNWRQDRVSALKQIKALAAGKFLVLDTETTGLDTRAEIIQIAVIDQDGQILLDTYVKPSEPIDEDGDAFAVHGIGNKEVADAPGFEAIWNSLVLILLDETVCIYNAPFDVRMLNQARERHGFSSPGDVTNFVDIMEPYSTYVGDWSARHGNYRWQRLPGGGHSALSDCQATLALIRKMAAEAE